MDSVEKAAGLKKLYQIGGFTTIILFDMHLKQKIAVVPGACLRLCIVKKKDAAPIFPVLPFFFPNIVRQRRLNDYV